MQPIGFVLLVIGVMLMLAAKRIVYGKIRLEDKDQEEFQMLAAGGVIAVRIAGLIVALIGVLFLLL